MHPSCSSMRAIFFGRSLPIFFVFIVWEWKRTLCLWCLRARMMRQDPCFLVHTSCDGFQGLQSFLFRELEGSALTTAHPKRSPNERQGRSPANKLASVRNHDCIFIAYCCACHPFPVSTRKQFAVCFVFLWGSTEMPVDTLLNLFFPQESYTLFWYTMHVD
jgi:hypothetical protein